MSEIDKEYYGQYWSIIKKIEKMVLDYLESILESLSTDEEHALAEHVRSRIKRSESLIEKLERKGLTTDVNSAIKNITDVVGVRVCTHFVGDVYTIFDALKESERWEIVKVKDYISMPKENGYRSLHVILSIPITEDLIDEGFSGDRIEDVKVEIQLRTIAMDSWASLEHQMKYKKDINNTELIISELKRCADEMASTDLTMQAIREMIV